LEQFRERLEPRPTDWSGRPGSWPGRKPGSYQWYEIQDSIDYYRAFDKTKILWPEIGKLPRFSWDAEGLFINNKGFLLATDEPWLLCLLQSRVQWFCISQLCVPLRLRGGLWQYQCEKQSIDRLRVPEVPEDDKQRLTELAMRITGLVQDRYKLHQDVRHRILTDLGGKAGKLNQKLHSWWGLGFSGFRTEVKKALKTGIPVGERAEWEKALQGWKGTHEDLTKQIVQLEEEANDRVYRLFDMSSSDIRLMEEHARHAMIDYPYGEP